MKILFVCGNLTNGGAQRVVSILSKELLLFNHTVYIIALCRMSKEYDIAESVKVSYISDNNEQYAKMSLVRKGIILRKLIKSIKPDVAVGFLQGGYSLYTASLGMNFSKIASLRNNPKVELCQKGLRGFLTRKWYKEAKIVVAQNERQKKLLPEALQSKTYVIPNPYNGSIKNREKDKVWKNKIIMVGRLEKQKNYFLAIDAVKMLKEKGYEYQVDIFGVGSQYDKISKKINDCRLSESVKLKGWSNNVADEYHRYDIFLLTSDYEGMPNALIEAMASYLICISADCETGPSDLIIHKKNGFLFQVGNAEQIVENIINIDSMAEDERKQIREEAAKTVLNEHNSHVIAEKWDDLFCKYLN